MAAATLRLLRSCGAEGEGAMAVVVADSAMAGGARAVLRQLLGDLCRATAAGHAAAKAIAVVALESPPEDYWELAKGAVPCAENSTNSVKHLSWFRVIDGFSDPLGWEREASEPLLKPPEDSPGQSQLSNDDQILKNVFDIESSIETAAPSWPIASVMDLDRLRELLLEAGKDALPEGSPKAKVTIVFDSVSVLLRHNSLFAVSSFLDSLRWTEAAASLLLPFHADLHPPSVLNALNYLANASLSIEPPPPLPPPPPSAPSGGSHRPTGIVRLLQKRRTGKVLEQVEAFDWSAETDKVVFYELAMPKITLPLAQSTDSKSSRTTTSSQVPFSLELSEKEKADRARVVLPYEHQGEGKSLLIYDGRKREGGGSGSGREAAHDEGVDLKSTGGRSQLPRGGLIHYVREAEEDEGLDSDEDPDDDLDL